MKISAVLSKKHSKHKSDTDLINLIVAAATIICAVVSGTVLVYINYDFFGKNLGEIFISYFKNYSSEPIYIIIISILQYKLLSVLLCFVFGSSIYGKAPIIITTFFNITGLSVIAAFILLTYGLKGLEFYLLICLPGNVLSVFTTLFTAKKCLDTSNALSRILLNNESAEYEKLIYIKQLSFASVLVFISALCDTVLIKVFSPLFSFS